MEIATNSASLDRRLAGRLPSGSLNNRKLNRCSDFEMPELLGWMW